MISNDQAHQLVSGGGNVIGRDGEKIGQIGQVFLDDRTDEPEWITVRTGLFGTGESFVPLREASLEGHDLRVPYDKATVKDAPRIDDADSHLDEADEDRLFTHYGASEHTSDGPTDSFAEDQHDASTGRDGSVGHDVSGPNTDSAMTRSEEQLRVGTERRPTGRARLRKHVVTENVATTVPVSREEVRVEREPITDANIGDATSGGELTSEEHEVVLHEERPVVEKETVPVERVRVDVDTVSGQEQVDEQVRKEQIELDEDTAGDAVGDVDRDHDAGTGRG